ncbi:MAG: polysaccharide deacetylase family protein [Solirubrobacteraceae bacterium]
MSPGDAQRGPDRRRQVTPRPRGARRGRTVAALAIAAVAAVALGAPPAGGCGGAEGGRASKGSATAARSRRQAGPPAAVPATAPGAHRAPHEAVPVLFYHVINRPPPGTAQPELWVSRDDFAAQVTALARRGYHAVTLQQVYDAWHRGGLLPSKPIVFSFDDGYHSQYTNALPILRARGWPGVLNLEVKLLATDLRPPEVRAMIAAGWEVDAHTFTHPDLTTLPPARLREEVAGSRQAIRRRFGVPVNFFCYPAGRFDPAVQAEVRAAGYLGATTTEPGLASPASPPLALRRVRVNGSDGVAGLERSLAAAGA